jgi:phosphatidylglycerophosphate synthase
MSQSDLIERARKPMANAPIKNVKIEMLLVITATGVLTAAAALAVERFYGFPSLVPLMLLAVIGAFSLERLGTYHPHNRLGWANVVTFLRAGMICLFAAPLFAHDHRSLATDLAWIGVAVALIALALDGIDGILARRQKLTSRFGARLDMELDALFILILSALALMNDKAGPWVLLIGLMRYIFVVASWFAPSMRQDLPPSQRRKAVCALQVLILIVLLAPPVTPPFSVILAFGGLLAIVWSFAVDTAFLLKKPAT